MFLVNVAHSASWGGRNKAPHAGRLNTTETRRFPVWRPEAWMQVTAGPAPSRGSRGASFLPLELLGIPGVPELMTLSLHLCLRGLVASLCASPFFCLTRTLVIRFRV